MEDLILSDEIELTDLDSMSPPFFPKTFTKWRVYLWEKHVGESIDFVRSVDETFLPQFLRKVTKRYFQDSLKANPELKLGTQVLNSEDYQQELLELSDVLSKWSSELELALDIIERVQLYGLYEPPEGLKETYKELKQEWDVSEEPLMTRGYRFLLKSLAYGTGKITAMIQNRISGILSVSIAQSKSTIIASVLYTYFCGVFPWPVLALLGTQLSWMVSSYLISKLGSRISTNLDRSSVSFYIGELKQHFEKLLSDLIHRNEVSKLLIRECLTNHSNQPRIALSEHLNQVILHNNAGVKMQTEYDEDVYIADNCKIEQEGEWLKISLPDFDFQEEDEWTSIA